MVSPRILISAINRDIVTCGKDGLYTGVNVLYPAAVFQSGGIPIILPCIEGESWREALDFADGVLLTGGGDICPSLFGGQMSIPANQLDPLRDAIEIDLVRTAMLKGIPILGICRGLQVINVACGGTLIQDIDTQLSTTVRHDTNSPNVPTDHVVTVDSDSMLRSIVGTGSFTVNSRHHQAAGDLGLGLRVNCRALDGVVEGIESTSGSPVLAVQFHPEDPGISYEPYRVLFNWLVSHSAIYSLRLN